MESSADKSLNWLTYAYPYNLQFFANEGPGGEKTEDATTKKLKDAREEGQVAKSQEIISAASLMGLFFALKLFVSYMGNSFLESFQGSYNLISTLASPTEELNENMATSLMNDGIIQVIKISAPIFLFAVVITFTLNVAQVKWKPTTKTLKPKPNKLNPVEGAKRMFSMDKLFELVKAIAKVGIIGIVVYLTLKNEYGNIVGLYEMKLEQAILYIGNLVLNLGVKISASYLIIAAADFFYQKMKFKKDMRMTKQEVKDEYKQQEGDPQIKGKIKQKMREAAQRRMMQELPNADVVITNPTHFACAIKYDKASSDAPILIAKGADLLAAKIKEVAKENKVEIVENKPLARMLYYNVEIGKQIPPELYQMTAEVLAYVYGLKNK